MASSYTTLLGLELPVQGELSGTWGDRVNAGITNLLDTAIAGTTTWSTDANITLSTTTGAANEARQAIILCSGARTAERTITAPAASKTYVIINATTGGQSVKIVGVGPTTGVVIPTLSTAVVAWNGSDFAVTGAIVSNGKLFRATQSLTLAGTDSTTMTFPTTSATIARTDAANSFTGTNTFGSATSLLLGTAGSAVGDIGFRNATSGTATLAPPTGALDTYSVTLPNAASTLPIFGQQITFAGPTAARTVTFPDASFTAARTDAANTFLANQTLSTATGSATPVATELRIQTTSNASDWSTTLPWGRLSFYSSDTTGAGPKVHAAIDAVAYTVNNGASHLSFKTQTNNADTLTERFRVLAVASTGGSTLELTNNTGLLIARTDLTAPVTADGNVYSGTYTPTLTNGTNVAASTASLCQYMRVGSVVTVSGQVDIDPTTGSVDTILGMSLPVASAFTGQTQAGGTFSIISATIIATGVIYADATNDRLTLRLIAPDASNRAYNFIATYTIA